MNTENHYQETDLGNIAPNPRGEYSESSTYEYLDYVYYQGGSYLCLAELGATITGIAPEPGKNTEYWQAVALPGKQGEPGTPGENGTTPHIGDSGNWYIGDVDTGIRGQGRDGANGITPHIGTNGNWYIGDVDTGVYSRGADGLPGTDGESGTDGVDGVTPHIGENKNWWVGETDTGITAEGKDGAPGQDGQPGQDGEPGQPGKSAYQYAQDGGYTGTEEEFAQKLAAEYPTDVQINGTSVVDEDGVASIPFARDNKAGVVKTRSMYGLQPMPGLSDGTITIVKPTEINIKTRGKDDGSAGYKAVSIDTIDFVLKYTMTDGLGPAWTDTEKTGAWSRLTSIKTVMDEVAVAGARYYLPEQTELSITLPDDALTGQEITVVWYNGETPATLAISGNMLDFDYVPGANSRSEISALWDGTCWSLISNEQSVPLSEAATDEA